MPRHLRQRFLQAVGGLTEVLQAGFCRPQGTADTEAECEAQHGSQQSPFHGFLPHSPTNGRMMNAFAKSTKKAETRISWHRRTSAALLQRPLDHIRQPDFRPPEISSSDACLLNTMAAGREGVYCEVRPNHAARTTVLPDRTTVRSKCRCISLRLSCKRRPKKTAHNIWRRQPEGTASEWLQLNIFCKETLDHPDRGNGPHVWHAPPYR